MKVLSTLIAIASAGQLMKDNDGVSQYEFIYDKKLSFQMKLSFMCKSKTEDIDSRVKKLVLVRNKLLKQ